MNHSKEELESLLEYRSGSLYWRKDSVKGRKGKKAACRKSDGYMRFLLGGKTILDHRIIFLLCHGWLPEMIDHIDGNQINNRIENLRPCTKSQNGLNRGIPSNNKSGVKGVFWCKRNKKWLARFVAYKKVYDVGRFDRLEDAKREIEAKREEVCGEFARHE